MKYAKFSDDFLLYFRLDDNGETLVLTDKRGYTRAVKLLPYEERSQEDCENCDFRKFSEQFIDGIVDVMNKNGITSVEQLSELLKGGNEE